MFIPVSVGRYIGGAFWFTSSSSVANPAVTLSRTPSDRYTGIAQGSTAVFIAAEVLSTGLAVLGYVG